MARIASLPLRYPISIWKALSWWTATASNQLQGAVLPVSAIGALILALVTIFKPTLSPWTAPLYAAFEGVALGAISALIEHSHMRGTYPGIAMQDVAIQCSLASSDDEVV